MLKAVEDFKYYNNHNEKSKGLTYQLDFVIPPEQTKMYCNMQDEAIKKLKTQKTAYFHSWAYFTQDDITKNPLLDDFWQATTVSEVNDVMDVEMLMSYEAKDYPFFATQFHPEKISQVLVDEFEDEYQVEPNHSWESIELMSNFGKLFVAMSRANTNTFGDFETT